MSKEVNSTDQKSLTEVLSHEIDELKSDYPEISAAAIVSSDGSLMAARPREAGDDRVAAMSAFLLDSTKKAAQSLGWSDIGYFMINHNDGFMIVAPAGKATIVITTSPRAQLGLLLYDLSQSAKRIGKVVNK